jgi:hypothetical protein
MGSLSNMVSSVMTISRLLRFYACTSLFQSTTSPPCLLHVQIRSNRSSVAPSRQVPWRDSPCLHLSSTCRLSCSTQHHVLRVACEPAVFSIPRDSVPQRFFNRTKTNSKLLLTLVVVEVYAVSLMNHQPGSRQADQSRSAADTSPPVLPFPLTQQLYDLTYAEVPLLSTTTLCMVAFCQLAGHKERIPSPVSAHLLSERSC